ncbi:MAG: hypothetical protein J6Z11_01830, partial [Candidatus Riflebacteria bacterium]|nr:hypothetical protein [Candidatus Riflebacteria bacterium]
MYLGDLKIDYRDKLNLDKDLNTIDLDKINNIKYEIIKSLGTRITAYDESKTLYCSKATDNFNFTDTIFKEDSNKTILDVSGLFALVKIIEEDNNSQRIICYKYETNNIPSSFMSEILDESSRIIDASIIANKYIAVLYDPTGDREYSIKLYSHTNEESGATITDTELDEDDVFSVGDYKPIGIKLAQKNDNPSEINSNDCYLVVLYIDAEEEGDYLIKIYDLSNNQVVAQSELDGFYIDSDISLFRKFTYLKSHNFYIETNSPNYPSFILNSNSIVEKSTL